MDEGIDKKKFKQLCEDVSEVKGALMGSPEYRQKGALERLDETEARSWRNYHKISRIWYYAIGAGAAMAAVFKIIEIVTA